MVKQKISLKIFFYKTTLLHINKLYTALRHCMALEITQKHYVHMLENERNQFGWRSWGEVAQVTRKRAERRNIVRALRHATLQRINNNDEVQCLYSQGIAFQANPLDLSKKCQIGHIYIC